LHERGERLRGHHDTLQFVTSWLARRLFEGGYDIGEMGRKRTPGVIGDEQQRFPPSLARRRYGMAFHCWDNREAGPDITVAIDETVVDRLFAVA